MRNVTDLETSKKLVKWMGGVETRDVYIRIRQHSSDTWSEWRLWSRTFPFSNSETTLLWHKETVPAYTTDDLMERLPKVIHEKEDRPTEKLYIDFNRWLAGYSATDNISGFTHSRKIAHFESTVELRSALAQLVLFCGESGYLEEGEG